MALSVHAECPITYCMYLQKSFQSRQTADIRRDTQSYRHVHTQIFSAEQHIINDDGCGIVSRCLIDRHIRESATAHTGSRGISVCRIGTVACSFVQRTDLSRCKGNGIVLCSIPGRTKNALRAAGTSQYNRIINRTRNQEGKIHSRTEGYYTGL